MRVVSISGRFDHSIDSYGVLACVLGFQSLCNPRWVERAQASLRNT